MKKRVRFLSPTLEFMSHEFYSSIDTNADSDDKLASLLSMYKMRLREIDQIKATMNELQSSERAIVERIWKMDTETVVLKGKCGDGAEVIYEYKEEKALFQSTESAKLTDVLYTLRAELNTTLYSRLFEARMARMDVQSYIDDVLWELHARPQLKSASGLPKDDTLDDNRQQDLHTLKQVINTLFAAYRRSHSPKKEEEEEQEDTFMEDVQSWLSHVANVFLRLAPLFHRNFLMLHLLQITPVQWAIPLIQPLPTDDQSLSVFADDYITLLRLLFDPSIHARPLQWTEDDYLLALDQLAIGYVYDTVLSSLPHLSAAFRFSSDFLAALDIGIRTFAAKSYVNLTKRLAQASIKIVQLLSSHIDKCHASPSSGSQPMDGLLKTVVDTFTKVEKANILHFLPALPYHAATLESLWTITMRLLMIDDYPHPKTLMDILDNLPNVSTFTDSLAENQMEGIYFIGCLANIINAVPQGAEDLAKNDNSELSAGLIVLIAHFLFTIAFLDTRLRDFYYKDVKDSFGSICTCHPFVISFLLRWTFQHFNEMEAGMASYLFRALPIEKWQVANDDLVILHQFLRQSSVASPEAGLARYLIQNLNFGFSQDRESEASRFQPWQRRLAPFLPYEIHTELAFLLLDVCQFYQPLPDTDKNANVVGPVLSAASLSTPTQTVSSSTSSKSSASSVDVPTPPPGGSAEIVDWCWKIVLQLKLYDCPMSPRAADIEKAITPAFLRAMIYHQSDGTTSHVALLVYVTFLLSGTSRNFLRFESSYGWDKLLLILRRGRPEGVVQIMSDIIPAFVYMHGDDLFQDENVFEFLRQMVEFKPDPVLRYAGARLVQDSTLFGVKWSGVGHTFGSHAWQCVFIDQSCDLSQGIKGGFCYCDLVLHSWVAMVFRKRDWMWHEAYVGLMDDLCQIAFCTDHQSTMRNMLAEEYRNLLKGHGGHNPSVSPRLSPVMGPQRNPLRLIRNMMPDTGYASLLAGEWSLMSLTASNLFRTPGVEQRSLWFAFEVLMLETIEDQDDRKEAARQLAQVDGVATNNGTATPVKKSTDFLPVNRWLQHCIACPPNHPLLPAFLQIFFCLYYANVHVDEKQTVFYGHVLFAKKQEQIGKLRDRIAHLQTYHGQRLNTNKDDTHRKKKDNPVQQDAVDSHHEELRKIYYAMWLWLGNPDIVQPSFDMTELPAHYCPDRLESCRRATTFDDWESHQPWNVASALWTDLIGKDTLQQEFMAYPWVGSAKFREDATTVAKSPNPSPPTVTPTASPPHTIPPPNLELTRPPLCPSPADLVTSDPQTILGSMIETMRQHAARYHHHLERYRALDVAYVKELGALYSNQGTARHVQGACPKHCKRPVQWDFVETQGMLDNVILSHLQDNRTEAAKLVFRSIDARIAVQVMLAFRKLDIIVAEAKGGKKAFVKLAKNCQSFVAEHLAEGEVKNFPPAKLVLSQTQHLIRSIDA